MDNDNLHPHQREIMNSLTEMVKQKHVLRFDIEDRDADPGRSKYHPVILCPKHLTPTGRTRRENFTGMFANVGIPPYLRTMLAVPQDDITAYDLECDIFNSLYARSVSGGKGLFDWREFLYKRLQPNPLFDKKPYAFPEPKTQKAMPAPSLLAVAIGFTDPLATSGVLQSIVPNLEWPYVRSKKCKLFR